VILRPNLYEPGRANITIYNWDRAASVMVDVSSVLIPGMPFELRNAQDFWSKPVLPGTYTGDPLVVPLALQAAVPVGYPVNLTPTGLEFNVFVLLPDLGPALDNHLDLPVLTH
jgi:hypothetical protein